MPNRTAVLATVSVTAAASFAATAHAVAQRSTSRTDRALRPKLRARKGHPARLAAAAIAPLGKWYVYLPASAALGMYVVRSHDSRARRAGGAAIMLCGASAYVLGKVFDNVLPQPPAPPGHARRTKPTFPSGHTFAFGSLAITTAYVLSREDIAPRGLIPLAALIPIIGATGKLVEEKHWASDVIGGAFAATALGAACALAYEQARR